MKQRIEFNRQWIEVSVVDGCGSIASNLSIGDEHEEAEFNASINGLESLLLAMACEGIDITTPSMVNAVKTAVEGIDGNT